MKCSLPKAWRALCHRLVEEMGTFFVAYSLHFLPGTRKLLWAPAEFSPGGANPKASQWLKA